MDVLVFQSADPVNYAEMLSITSRPTKLYCQKFNIAYESYIGIKRGYQPWHAAFNRLFIFQEILMRGYKGWVIYIDADAYISDMKFDIRDYLSRKTQHSAILTYGKDEGFKWDVNTGVMIFNFNDSDAKQIVDEWLTSFLAISDEKLKSMKTWAHGGADQVLLQKNLKNRDWQTRGILYEKKSFINSPSAFFIRQHLRVGSETMKERLDKIRMDVAEIISSADVPEEQALDVDKNVVTAIYRGILNREPDAGGLATYTNLLQHEGRAAGIQRIVRTMVNSPEFQKKYQQRLELAEVKRDAAAQSESASASAKRS